MATGKDVVLDSDCLRKIRLFSIFKTKRPQVKKNHILNLNDSLTLFDFDPQTCCMKEPSKTEHRL